MSETPVLQAVDLEKSFLSGVGKRRKITKAVNKVSLTLQPGQTLGLIGSSGCGKTTTLRLLLGLLRPDSGRVIRAGSIGFVGQDPYASLAPTLRIEQLIAEPLLFSKRVRRESDCTEAVRDALKLVHLDPDTYASRLPSQLSGGERQRVCIARAMILQPDFLILDEPTSMLDEAVKEKIMDVVAEITRTRMLGVLLVTHDIAVAARVCDRLMVMQDGKVIEQGPSSHILKHPEQKLTQDLIFVATDVRKFWEAR